MLEAGRILIGSPSEQQVQEIDEKLHSYYEEYDRLPNGDESKLRAYLMGKKCPFLLEDNLCSIYDHRPYSCQIFPQTDRGMNTEECEPLCRFKDLRKALLRGHRRRDPDTCFTFEDPMQLGFSQKSEYYGLPIKPVKMMKWRYDHTVARLLKAGMTQDELKLFRQLNGRNKL